jgi:hypothetical protein
MVVGTSSTQKYVHCPNGAGCAVLELPPPEGAGDGVAPPGLLPSEVGHAVSMNPAEPPAPLPPATAAAAASLSMHPYWVPLHT